MRIQIQRKMRQVKIVIIWIWKLDLFMMVEEMFGVGLVIGYEREFSYIVEV